MSEKFNLPQRVDQIACCLEGIKSRRVWGEIHTTDEFNRQTKQVQAEASDLKAGLCHFYPGADSPPDFRQAQAEAVFALRQASDHPFYERLIHLLRRVNQDEVIPWYIFQDGLRAASWEIAGFEGDFLSSPNPFKARLKLWGMGMREINFFHFGASTRGDLRRFFRGYPLGKTAHQANEATAGPGTQLVFHLPIRPDKSGERFGCFSEREARLLYWHYPGESCALNIQPMTFLDRISLPNS